MITQQLAPDTGTIDVGQNTIYGYYTQKELDFKPGQKVIDIVKDVAEVITMSDGSVITASYFLQHFQFAPKVQHDFVEKLSGGEKRRLQLLKVLMKNPNFLILDEPTNDLDLMTLGILEDFLDQFAGCLVIVSHDRYFMDRLVEHVFVLEPGKVIKDLPYNYSQFRAWKEVQQEDKQQVNKDKVKKDKSVSVKMSFKEKTEYEELEGEIAKLESQKEVLVEKLNQGEGSFDELASWSKEVKQLISKVEEKEMRWLELSEMVN
jgi:ATP-binding cassette subfamily F protein uup